MKRIVFIIMMIVSLHARCQCISVELSISWGKDENLSLIDVDTICCPYLNITYRNNSNTALYFLKATHQSDGLPYISLFLIPIDSLFATDAGTHSRAMNYSDFTGDRFQVYFGEEHHYESSWGLSIYDKIDHAKVPQIAFDLFNIYKYITLLDSTLSLKKQVKTRFEQSDVIADSILKCPIKNRFVFLKAGESYTDNFNLIGFQLVGGSFSFGFSPHVLKNYVMTNPIVDFDGELFNLNSPRAYLPEKVGEYSLYSGIVLTNEVKVSFKGNKSDGVLQKATAFGVGAATGDIAGAIVHGQ